MKLTITNIAKVASAGIECNGITAIIGENDNGKSTVGKVLYSLYRSLANLDESIYRAKVNYVLSSADIKPSVLSRRILRHRDFDAEHPIDVDDLCKRLVGTLYPHRYGVTESLMGKGAEAQSKITSEKLAVYIEKVRDLSEATLLHDAISGTLDSYFKCQFLPNYQGFSEGSEMTIEDRDARLAICWNSDEAPAHTIGRIEGRAWFVGTPLIMDALGAGRVSAIRVLADPINQDLFQALRRPEPFGGGLIARRIADKALTPVANRLNRYVNGSFGYNEEGELTVALDGMNRPLNVGNLSMGMKMVALLRLMLESNVLRQHDTLILDEPENHLHPELQVAFADVLVMLKSIYELKILVTTHSPYFLQALELANRRMQTDAKNGDALKVYQPRTVDHWGRVAFDDITGNTSEMYRRFAKTMRDLDLERASLAEHEREDGKAEL